MQLCKERIDFSALVAGQRDNDAKRGMSFHAGGTTPIPGWKQNSLGVEPQKMTVALSLSHQRRGDACIRVSPRLHRTLLLCLTNNESLKPQLPCLPPIFPSHINY